MSDLISRNEVNDVIDGLEVYTCGKPNIMKVEISVLQLQRFIKKLKNIPTAYDVDKVVNELEERRANHDCRVCKYYDKESKTCDQDCTDALIDDLIEIVRAGEKNG